MICDIFWGSHGCDKLLGHDGRHLCGACCLRFEHDHTGAPDGYGFDGCAGDWPYFGSHHMAGKTEHGLGFFRYSEANGWAFEYLPDEFDRMAAL